MFNKGVASKISMLFCTLVVSGCIVIKGNRNEWKDAYDNEQQISDTDLVSRMFKKKKYSTDNGKRVSIGILPGVGEFWDKGSITHPNYKGILPGTLPGMLLEFCAVVLWSTFESLLIEPFYDSTYSAYSLIGCHRYTSTPKSPVLLEHGPSEYQAKWTFNAKSFNTNCAIGKSEDGTQLYLDFPGGQKLLDEVNKNDKVDCLMPNGDLYRFMKSKYSYRTMTYEVISADAVANRQIEHQKKAKQLKKSLENLKTIEGYAFIDATLKADIDKLNSKVDIERKLPLPTSETILEDIENRYSSIEKRIKDNYETLRKNRKEEIEQMLKEKKYEDVVIACKCEMLDMQGKSLFPDNVWEEYIKEANKGIEEKNRALELTRVENQKKKIQALQQEKKWEEIIKVCEAELSTLNNVEHNAMWKRFMHTAEQHLFSVISMKAENGDKNAQFELGILYKKGSPIRVPDKKLARKWLRKAYDNGVEAAWQELNLLLNQ